MDAVLNWVKGIVIIFLVMSSFLYLVPGKQYKKYIYFFMEMVILIAVISPITKIVYNQEDFEKKIEYTQFWQELNNLQTDVSNMEFMQTEYYLDEYEQALEEDVSQMVTDAGFVTKEVEVELTEKYEINNIVLTIAQESEENKILIGKIDLGNDNNETEERSYVYQDLKDKIQTFYQLSDDEIQITLVEG